MIVSVHQPNFAPWLGFFDKMAHSDVLVLLDTVQFIKRGYQNRTRVKGPAGAQWLTVPVNTKGRYDQLTQDVEIDETRSWRQSHLRTLRGVLSRAPHADELLSVVEPFYGRPVGEGLTAFNVALIRAVAARLGISTRLVLASDLECRGSSTQLILDLTKAVGGDVYLSGPTGRAYLEPEMFPAEGVTLRYHEFAAFPYPQLFGAFLPGLSCLDYLANVGFSPWAGLPVGAVVSPAE